MGKHNLESYQLGYLRVNSVELVPKLGGFQDFINCFFGNHGIEVSMDMETLLKEQNLYKKMHKTCFGDCS